jgi:hypothetical protein
LSVGWALLAMAQAWIVELEVAGHLSPDSVRRLSEMLSAPTADDRSWRTTLRIDARDPAQAARRALDVVQPDGPVVRLQVLTVSEAERQLVSPRLPDLVGVLDVQELAGLRTKQRALQVTRLPDFPLPALVTRAGRLWVRTAVERFLSEWPRRTGRPPGQIKSD